MEDTDSLWRPLKGKAERKRRRSLTEALRIIQFLVLLINGENPVVCLSFDFLNSCLSCRLQTSRVFCRGPGEVRRRPWNVSNKFPMRKVIEEALKGSRRRPGWRHHVTYVIHRDTGVAKMAAPGRSVGLNPSMRYSIIDRPSKSIMHHYRGCYCLLCTFFSLLLSMNERENFLHRP